MTALLHPVVLVLATMAVQWLGLTPGGLSVVYPALAAVVLWAAINPPALRASLGLLRAQGLWIGAYALYLPILVLALWGSPGAGLAPRQAVYLMAAVAIAGSLVAARRPARLLRLGGGLCIAVFALAIELKARQVGLGWGRAIGHFLSTGDLDFVVYSFFRAAFNAGGAGADAGEMVKAAEKNAVAVCLLAAALLARAAGRRRGADLPGLGLMALALGMIVLLNTRSVLIVAAAALGLAWLLRHADPLARRPSPAALRALGLTAALAGLALLLGVLLAVDHPVLALLSERFAFGDQSTDHRLAQYAWAIRSIEANFLTGQGYAEVDDGKIHNLFLGAWVHAGLAAFALVVTFYLAILWAWLSFLWRLLTQPGHWRLELRPEWIAVLPLLPLFRVWISGDAGHLFLGEWIVLAVFCGMLRRNALRRRGGARTADPAATPWLRHV